MPGLVQNCPTPSVTDAASPRAISAPRSLAARGRTNTGFEEPISANTGIGRGRPTATVHAEGDDLGDAVGLLQTLRSVAGRLLFGGFPTGVEVSAAMHHGGPWPAASVPGATSVGTAAIRRFVRPVCFQDAPDAALPAELRRDNPRGILRTLDGALTRDPG